MSDGFIVAGAGFLLTLFTLIRPIINLTTCIAELKESINQFKESINKLDTRITAHGQELDKLREDIAMLKVRVENLEQH